jgi:hypothetical protein
MLSVIGTACPGCGETARDMDACRDCGNPDCPGAAKHADDCRLVASIVRHHDSPPV